MSPTLSAGVGRRGRWGLSVLHWRALVRFAPLATAAAISACAVGPDFKIPAAPTVTSATPRPLSSPGAAGGERQQFVRSLDIPGAWWTLFHSRQLSELMQRALRDNYDLKAAQAALRVAHANTRAQIGAFFPLVSANYSPSRQKTATGDLAPLSNSGDPFLTLHTGQLTVFYVPDVFGGNRRVVE